jgi:hypothetical protein
MHGMMSFIFSFVLSKGHLSSAVSEQGELADWRVKTEREWTSEWPARGQRADAREL